MRHQRFKTGNRIFFDNTNLLYSSFAMIFHLFSCTSQQASSNGKWILHDLDRIHALLVDQKCEVSILERQPTHLIVSYAHVSSNLTSINEPL